MWRFGMWESHVTWPQLESTMPSPISCARVVDAIQGLCWKALPNCLYVAMVTGDALGLMPAYIRASGVSMMATASGVKQYWHQPRGSNIMILISVAIFKGSMMKSMHSWMRWFLRTLCILLFLWRNFGTGRMVRSMNARWDDFIWKSMTMSARLIRRGWVMQFPVTAEILVLSKDMMVPKRVMPSGSWLCLMSVFHIANEELATHLHLPYYIPSPPLTVDAHQLLQCLEDVQRLKLQCIL